MSDHTSMDLHTGSAIRVRPYVADDQSFVLSLAPRLLIGFARWRDPAKMLTTVEGWLTDGMAHQGTETMIFIAENERAERLGFATASHDKHFTGERQAQIGELVVSEDAEGQGVGRALVAACEQWTREQGYAFLTLATGAANEHARRFYQHLGFLEEDIKLVKLL